MNIDIDEVEQLVVDMILEKRLVAQIDQINQYIDVGDMYNTSKNLQVRKLEALGKWADAISNFSERFYEKLS